MEDIQRGFSFLGGISITVEIKTKEPCAPYLTIDLTPCKIMRELSISGNGGNKYGWGQMQDTLRELLKTDKRRSAEGKARLLRVLDIWDRWHLNGMKGGTRFKSDALKSHEAQHRDCHASHRGDLYAHQCQVLKGTAPFTVWVDPVDTDADTAAALIGKRKRKAKVQASPETFSEMAAAQAFADSFAEDRKAEVVGLYIDRGYKFGSAWLCEPLPLEVEAELIDILNGKPARVAPDTTTPRQISKDEAETEKVLAKLPAVPDGAEFRPVEVRTIALPHPYMVTSQCFDGGMYLNTEKPCGQCGKPGSAHEQQKTLFIEVVNNRDLNSIVGLHAYLLAIKPQMDELGVQGFAFPNKNDATENSSVCRVGGGTSTRTKCNRRKGKRAKND